MLANIFTFWIGGWRDGKFVFTRMCVCVDTCVPLRVRDRLELLRLQFRVFRV